MIEYIYHITMNTGHIRKTYPSEVDKELYFVLNRIYREALTKEGVRLFDKYILKGSKFEGGAIFTLFGDLALGKKQSEEIIPVPILTTVSVVENADSVWEDLFDSATVPLLTTEKKKKVPVPCIIDRIDIGGTNPNFIEAFEWTGDMTRILGWMTLDPSAIR